MCGAGGQGYFQDGWVCSAPGEAPQLPAKPLIIQRRKCVRIYSREGNAQRVPTGGQIWKPGVNYS